MFYALLSAMSEKVLNSGETYTGGRGHRETLNKNQITISQLENG